MRLLNTLLLILALFASPLLPAAVIKVPAQYPTIQAGIDAANDGDTVLVANGVYTGDGNRNIDFTGKAITLKSENGAEHCIIDCQQANRGFIFHSGEQAGSVVRGFTIQNGDDLSGYGGGIHCEDHSSPTIIENIIKDNYSYRGGGIYCYDHASPIIRNNQIIGNSTYAEGAGIMCDRYCSPQIEDNIIGHYHLYDPNKNIAGSNGGAIYCNDFSAPLIRNNLITGNEANSGEGGGIHCHNDSAPLITNNLIANNESSGNGAGIYCRGDSEPVIINCTIADNLSEADGGGLYSSYCSPTVASCIFYGNFAPYAPQIGGYSVFPTVNCSLVDGGYSGIDIIDADPLFVDGPWANYWPANLSPIGGYYLDPGSPCVDSGCTPMITGTTRSDWAQDSGVVDMGFHYPLQAIWNQPEIFSFDTETGGTPPSQQLSIQRSGVEEMSWTVEENTDWLTLTPQSGTSNGETDLVTVSVDTTGLNDGSYLAAIILTATYGEDNLPLNNPVIINVILDIAGGGPIIFDCDYTVLPSAGTVPFPVMHRITLTNTLTGGQVYTRRVAARLKVTIGNGTSYNPWRTGFTNIQPGSFYFTQFPVNFPAAVTVLGNNTFTMDTMDVTPSPYNQPPYPPSGQTCQKVNVVVANAP